MLKVNEYWHQNALNAAEAVGYYKAWDCEQVKKWKKRNQRQKSQQGQSEKDFPMY